MARARAGDSGSGWAVATVIFGVAFVICLILAIIFAVKLADAQKQAEDNGRQLSEFITPVERGSESLSELRQRKQEERQASIYELLNEDSAMLRRIVSGADSSLLKVQADINALNLEDGVALVNSIETLRAEVAALTDERDQAQAAHTQAVEDLKLAQQEKADAAEQFQQAATSVRANLVDLQEDFDEYQQAKDAMMAELDEHLDSVRTDLSGQVSDLQSTADQRQQKIRELNQRVADMIREIRRSVSGQMVAADGYIVAIDPTGDLAYINLTRNDRLLPGTTFEVFEPNVNIRIERGRDGDDQVRGKATLEIVKVDDNSSTARVVRLERYAAVGIDDQIVNLVYDRKATYRFHVHGEFDVDRRGAATMTDQRRVQAMIRQWGGEVDDAMSYQTDFLVLGLEPEAPGTLPADATLLQVRQNEEEKRIFDEYQSLISVASDLRIPILNQNRFLSLVGYYRQ